MTDLEVHLFRKTLTSAGWEGLVMGQGGGGLLGGSGLVLGGADGDSWGDSECCKLCLCAA